MATQFSFDSCNENLPEKRIHRNYARSLGGMPRQVFCCAPATAVARGGFLVFAEKTGKYRRPQPCSFRKAKAGIRPADRAGHAIGQRSCMRGWRCKLQVAETSGHCFAPVLYNENTYSDVWRRKRRGRSPDRAKRDPGISQAAMMRTS